MVRIFFICLLLMVTALSSQAQSRKSKKNTSPQRVEQASQQPTSLAPVEKKIYVPKQKKATSGPTFNAEQDFVDRMAKLEKTRAKTEKMMQKPQYSDPMYFGHKRPPKKRKPGKMKYCKECGMRH